MSNYNSLKATIDANIKQNGNQEITGQVLNSVLNAMVTTLGTGYQFAGVATIATNPGTPDAKVFYIANGKGTYEKFGGLEVTEDDVVVFYWDTAWHKVATGIASNEKLSELEYVIGGVTVSQNFDFSDDTRRAISNSGDIHSSTSYRRSALIPINKGDIIKFSIFLNAFDALIAFTNDDTNFVVKVSNENTSSSQDVEWVSDSDGYVVVSSNRYFTPTSYTIIKGGITGNMSLLKEDVTKIEAEIDDVRKGLYGSSIFDVNKKQYFKNLFIQANWASRDGGNTPHISPLVMLWFSDIHGSQYNYNRLIEFKNYFNEYIQASICTGDIVQSYYSNDFSYFTANDIMLVIGNHDVQDSTTGEHSHIGIDAYNKYFAPFISNWGVIQPENAATEGLCYYYKDFTDRGIRLIVLDKMAWNSAQNTWLQEVLTDAKNNNLAVICANHYPASNTNLNRDCSFCSLYTNEIGGMPVDAINSIQSFIDNEHGEFICHLSGHTHTDYYGIISGTTQISITIDCAYANYDAWNDSDRVSGEKSADCFNILSIDTYDKTIKMFRVGVDRDRWLRHKGTMCVKYDTRELLWND